MMRKYLMLLVLVALLATYDRPPIGEEPYPLSLRAVIEESVPAYFERLPTIMDPDFSDV
jgi:hypothetical protein